MRLTMTMNLTDDEMAELANLQFNALPQWAKDRIRSLEAEVKRLKSDRAYIIGFNDGFAEAS